MSKEGPAKRLPPPEGCSSDFAKGWSTAQAWISDGAPLDIDLHVVPDDWSEEKALGFRTRIWEERCPSIQAPAGCSAEYREGWEAAEEWIRCGEPVTAEHLHAEVMPGGMTPDQTAGFRARIMRELEPDSGQVLSFRPRPRPA